MMALDIKKLLALADYLDQKDQCEAADQIDGLIKKISIVMVQDPDEELKKQLEEKEGFGPETEIYVGKPEEELGPEDILMPGEAEPLVGEELKAELSKLSESGWDIFGPGELEQWLEMKGYKKTETLPEEADTEDMLEEISAANIKDVIFEKLSNVADKLDKVGAKEEADLIDDFIQKSAYDALNYKGEDPDAESSKAYDSKHHHGQQVREPPKRPKDLEGRDEHHGPTYQPGEGSLSTRYCPIHKGVMLGRVGENTYQCNLDGAVYNWETGYVDSDGNEIPGGSVAGQSPSATGYFAIPHRIFDSRESVLNRVN